MPRNARNTPFTARICVGLYAHLNTASTGVFQFLGSFFISAPAFRFTGATISRHFSAALGTLSCYSSHLARMQFIAHFNQIIASAVFTLQAFLQLKYQGITDHNHSLFSTHPAAMHVVIASSAAYFFAYAALLHFPLHRFAFLAHHFVVSSGYTFVVSLASALLTDKAAAFVYAVFGSLSAAKLLFWLHHKLVQEQNEEDSWFQRVRIRIRIRRFLNNIWGRDVALAVSGQWMPRLPV